MESKGLVSYAYLNGDEIKKTFIGDEGGQIAATETVNTQGNKVTVQVVKDVSLKIQHENVTLKETKVFKDPGWIKIIVDSPIQNDIRFVQTITRSFTVKPGKTAEDEDGFGTTILGVSYVRKYGETYLDTAQKSGFADAVLAKDKKGFWNTVRPPLGQAGTTHFYDNPDLFEKTNLSQQTATFTTYLVYKNSIICGIEWKKMGKYENEKWKVSYSDIKISPVKELPAFFKNDTVPMGYVGYTRDQKFLSSKLGTFPNPLK